MCILVCLTLHPSSYVSAFLLCAPCVYPGTFAPCAPCMCVPSSMYSFCVRHVCTLVHSLRMPHVCTSMYSFRVRHACVYLGVHMHVSSVCAGAFALFIPQYTYLYACWLALGSQNHRLSVCFNFVCVHWRALNLCAYTLVCICLVCTPKTLISMQVTALMNPN